MSQHVPIGTSPARDTTIPSFGGIVQRIRKEVFDVQCRTDAHGATPTREHGARRRARQGETHRARQAHCPIRREDHTKLICRTGCRVKQAASYDNRPHTCPRIKKRTRTAQEERTTSALPGSAMYSQGPEGQPWCYPSRTQCASRMGTPASITRRGSIVVSSSMDQDPTKSALLVMDVQRRVVERFGGGGAFLERLSADHRSDLRDHESQPGFYRAGRERGDRSGCAPTVPFHQLEA